MVRRGPFAPPAGSPRSRGRLGPVVRMLLACAGALAVGLSLVATAGPALGAPPPTSAAASAGTPVRVVVVLDVSGSMRRVDGSGSTLLDGARRALRDLVESLPADTEIGLRVYGSSYGGTDRTISCRDTRLLVPVQRVDAGRVVRAAAGLRPTGDTPIGFSLERAAGDVGTGAASRRIVVLISDGEDNCSPPAPEPCQVAAGLRRSGVNVRVETVGVALRDQSGARSALQCIADRTGGHYFDAEDTDALGAAIERIGSETLGALGAGTPVVGAARRPDAPLLKDGAYRFAIKPGQSRWFDVAVHDGQQPRVLATIQGLRRLAVPVDERSCPAWRAALFNPYGEGGTYPPYASAGLFDGVGYGAAGASSSGPASAYNQGIDFDGVWSVELSLAQDTLLGCSAHLPKDRAFTARFSISTDRPGGDGTDPGGSTKSSHGSTGASTSPSPGATASGGGSDDGSSGRSSAAAKYDTPVSTGAPAWLYPVVAVGALVVAAGIGLGLLLMRRRRRRGW